VQELFTEVVRIQGCFISWAVLCGQYCSIFWCLL